MTPVKRLSFTNAMALVFVSDFVSKIALLFLDGFIIASLPADQIAIFLLFSFFIRFAPYSGFGTISYITKVLPQAHEQSDQQQVVLNASRMVFLLAAIYFGVALLLFYISASGDISEIAQLAIAFLAISLILIMTMQQTVSRSLFAFPVYVVSQMLQAILALGLGLFLIPPFGINGLYTAVLMSYGGAIIVWWLLSPQKLWPSASTSFTLSDLMLPLRAGGWFFLLTISLFFIQSLDRFAVLQLGDVQAQTMFGVGFLFYQMGIIVINSIGKVAGPMIISGQSKFSERQSTNMLCLFCLAAYFLVFLFYLAVSTAAADRIPIRFQAAQDVATYYLTSGFITALGLALVPELLKNNSEKLLLLIVGAICLFFCGIITFSPGVFQMPKDFAVFSLLIATFFSLATIHAPVQQKKIRLGHQDLMLRTGCVLVMATIPLITALGG